MNLIQLIAFEIVIRPLVLIVIGLNVRDRDRLRIDGASILVANHNSHLDTLVLMTLFDRKTLRRIRPVAASDYFFATPLRRWIATNVMNIVPIDRDVRAANGHPLDPISDAVQAGAIVILFPEGSRGEPEQRAEFKTGIAHLAKRHAETPVVPIYMHGLGKALPKGDWVFVPFFCDVFVGEPIAWDGNRQAFMHELDAAMETLESRLERPEWT